MEVTIDDGGFATRDSSEVLPIVFDYDDVLAAGVQLASVGTITVTPVTGAPTVTSIVLMAGNRKVMGMRSGGTVGRTYTYEHTVQTNEVPAPTYSPWIKERIT